MNCKVLLIEDDKTMLTLLGTLLQMEGFEVLKLERDDELDSIVDAMQQKKPDVVLLDVNLRQLNGFDLLKSMRQNTELQHTRVIMSSGIDFSERCKREGANDFILKPYMPEDLIEKIRCTISEQNPPQ